MSDLKFQECGECIVKPGSPYLCESCLHNRKVIGELQRNVTPSMAEAMEELSLAMRRLLEAFAESLHLFKLLDWLEEKLTNAGAGNPASAGRNLPGPANQHSAGRNLPVPANEASAGKEGPDAL